jgi:hypothetical protein
MSHNLVSNSRIIGEKVIGKDLEGNSHGIIKVLYWRLLGGTEENHSTLSQDNRCPSRDSNKALTEYKSRILLLYQSAQCFQCHFIMKHAIKLLNV